MSDIPFHRVTDADLLKAQLYNRCRLSDTGCWEWTAGKGAGGYGAFTAHNNTRKAHRVSYEAFVGPIPKGLKVLHSCDNPGCINPNHLRPGTQKENAADRQARGRWDVKGEQIGTSKLTENDVLAIRASTGVTLQALGERYGVDKSNIWAIRAGRSWKHLQPAMSI